MGVVGGELFQKPPYPLKKRISNEENEFQMKKTSFQLKNKLRMRH
ncbi:hypothetical protein HMPREF1433_00849 [Helicobacter pylori GAMchJs117Ai]|nr:hypothetical protein HMPREF1433_00849 [Helicobacter pylori GAMchJs117Ai]